MEEDEKYYLELVDEIEGRLIEFSSFDDYDYAKTCVNKIFEIHSYLENLYRYEWKNKEKIITRRLLTMFCHELNSILGNYELSLRLAKKNGDESRISYYKKNLLNTMESMLAFFKECLNGGYPDKVTFYEYGYPFVYTAVYNDKAYGAANVYIVVKKDDIEKEKKILKDIIKRGGAYYYKDMLNELESGEYGKRLLVVD